MAPSRSLVALALASLLVAPACSDLGARDGGSAEIDLGTAVAGEGSDATPPAIDPSSQEIAPRAAASVGRFSKRRAMTHVRRLASDIGIRVKGTDAETRGARYMARKLRGFGYQVEIQRFEVDGRTSRNVVARWPGARRYPLVIGGHLDTVPGSPGANDNASGVATIIELARIFKDTSQAQWIHFVGFGAEEYGPERISHHDGSAHFVSKLGNRGRRRLAGMISVDMIADGTPLLVGNSNISGRHKVANALYNKIRRRNISVNRITLCDCSDHGPFEHAGMDAGFAYSGQEPDYHSPSDTVPNLSSDDLLRTGRALRFFLRDVSKEMLDRFRKP